jgi:glycosyltransferase involved in cell wall biosynthesis
MRVLHITNNYPTVKHPIFGIFVKEQIEALNNLGIRTDLFFINGRENGYYAYVRGVWDLRRILRNGRFDILHCHHAYSAVIAFMSGIFLKKRIIVSYQNDPEREGGKLLYFLIKSFAKAIILKNATYHDKSNKVIAIPNGVNTDFFRNHGMEYSKEKLNLRSDRRYVVFMDSYKLRTQKRVDRFDRVIKELNSIPGFEDIEPLILTNTERSLVPLYISCCHLHLVTSDFEGSPNSVKECIACDVPVVSTNVGDVSLLLGDIDGSFIAKTMNVSELVQLSVNALNQQAYKSRSHIRLKQLDRMDIAVRISVAYNAILENKQL